MRKNAVIELDVTKNIENGVKFYVKQFDDIKVKAKVYEGSREIELEGQNVVVYILKEDKTIIEQRKDITIEDNTLIVDLTKQASTCLGKCHMEILLKDEDGTSSTSTVSYVVGEKLSATISEIIKSEDSIDALDMIEEFIENSNIDMIEIKEGLQVLKNDIEEAKESIGVDLEAVLAKIKELEESVLANIADTTNEAVEKAEDAVLVANETLETVNTIKEEVEKLNEEIDGAIDEIGASKDTVLDEIAGAAVVIEDTREQAIIDIDGAKVRAIGEINEVKDSVVNDISESVFAIEEARDEAVEAVSVAKDTAIGEVYATRDVVVGEVYATRDVVVREISGTKDVAMGEMTAKKDALIEELSQVETGTIEGVDEAVNAAQERLQELTIQCTWEVQKTSADEKDALEAVSGTEQRAIHEKANEQIERVNQAGAGIVEMVEGLEANIEDGLAQIEETTRSGKSEIIEMSNAEVDRIKATGAEITEAVAELEINTTNNVDRINRAGESNVNRVESVANSCIGEINSIASEQKELIRDAGNEKLEEIDAILGVSKGEVEELLETTRQEIQTHRTEITTRVNLGLEEIGNLKNNSLAEMTAKKDELIEEMLGTEIALKEDFKTLRDQYVQEIDDRGQLRVDALQNMIDSIDALQLAVDRKLEISEKRSETLENTLTDVDNKIDEIRPILDSLAEMRNICISLQQENAEANANIEELDFLHIESDTRIVELRRLIELADVVIEARSGNHDEINARLDALEEAMAELEIPSIDHLATKEELTEAVNSLATKEELEAAISSIETPTPGAIENVVITEWDMPADLTIFDTLNVPENFESVFCGRISNTYDCVVAFFNRKVEASVNVSYSYGYRYLSVKDFSNIDIVSMYGYTSGAWKVISASSYANYFGGNASGNNYIVASFYHDFKIYDNRGNLWRQEYGAEVGENTTNDFNNATVVNNYSVNQKDGELLGNSPIEGAYNGVLEVEITDSTIKQELNTDEGITYKRFCKNGNWSNWDRCVDSKMKNDFMATNNGSFSKGIRFLEAPASIATTQPFDEFDVYPQSKHNLKYFDGSYYYNIFFFQDLTKESGKYITYTSVINGNTGYNRIIFNNLTPHEDYVVYRTDSKTVAPTSFTNTTISTININNNFRLYHYDFDMYNEDLSGISLHAPAEGLNDFDKAVNNGHYKVDMDATDFKDVANSPNITASGTVIGDLEVINGKQILTLTSHNRIYVRNIGEGWKDISDNSVSKDIVSSIKVSDKELPPAFLKILPIDHRYFRQQDKKTVIIRKSETEYMVFRTNHAALKPYINLGSNTTFYLGNTQQNTQIDTYNTETATWTTSLPTSSSSYSISCAKTHFKILHSDVDVYTSSNCTEVYQEAISIDFNVEKTINDFDDAVEVGTYVIDINASDDIANSPVMVDVVDEETRTTTGELKGILQVLRAGNNVYQEVIPNDNLVSYRRNRINGVWTVWRTI